MKSLLGFFVAMVLVAAVSSFVTLRVAVPRSSTLAYDSHEWLHKELKLTAEQITALEPIEERFATREAKLRQQMREANRELAAAIGSGKPSSPAVSAAVEKVHHHMGELQKASIEHLFEMREVLTPAQRSRLMELARRTLEETP